MLPKTNNTNFANVKGFNWNPISLSKIDSIIEQVKINILIVDALH